MCTVCFGPPFLQGNNTHVFLLQPGQFDDEIHFSFVVTAISINQPEAGYEAIQYTRGYRRPEHTMFHDDLDARRVPVSGVRGNSFNVLRQLRSMNRVRSLWVNCLRMIQTDLGELTAQVAIIGLFYAPAEEVVTYVGAGVGDSDGDINFLVDQYLDN